MAGTVGDIEGTVVLRTTTCSSLSPDMANIVNVISGIPNYEEVDLPDVDVYPGELVQDVSNVHMVIKRLFN